MANLTGKTILIVTPGFPADEKDSTCIPFLQDYVLSLKKIVPEENIKVLAFQYPHKKGFYKWNGIEVFSANGQNERGIVKIITWQRIISQLKHYFSTYDDVIIHSFWLTEATLISQFVNRKWGFKQIATVLGQDAKPGNKYLKRLKFNKFLTVVPNQRMNDLLKLSSGKDSDACIPFAVKKIDIPATPQIRDIDLLFTGSMIPLKQPGDFLKICALLKSQFPGLKATMIGDGVLFNTIETEIKNLNLEGTVSMTGKIPRDQVFEYMNRSKILGHTSAYESQPTVGSEALACGMYMMTYDIGRIENSAKVNVCRDAADMAAQIAKLLNSSLNYTPEQTRTIDTVVTEYLELYAG